MSLSDRVWKGHVLYGFSYKTCWKRQSYGDSKEIRDWAGVSTEDFGEWNHYDTRMVDTRHDALVQTHGASATVRDPDARPGPGWYDVSVRVCPVWQTHHLLAMVGVGVEADWGAGETSVLSAVSLTLNLHKLKTFLKNTILYSNYCWYFSFRIHASPPFPSKYVFFPLIVFLLSSPFWSFLPTLRTFTKLGICPVKC